MTSNKINKLEIESAIDDLNIVLAQNKQEGLDIQSLIMSKERFKDSKSAKNWAKDHGFKSNKVDETEDSFRLRQFEPNVCKNGSFRTFELTNGVKAVGCRKK